MKRYFTISLCLCSVFALMLNLNGQHKKYDTGNLQTDLKFRRDSVTTSLNTFAVLDILKPIYLSDAPVEIRWYHAFSKTTFSISVLKIYRDSVVGDKVFCNNVESLLGDARTFSTKDLTYAKLEARKKVSKQSKLIKSLSNSVLTKINSTGIFTITDQSNLLDSLANAGYKVIDPCKMIMDCDPKAKIFFEIKLGNLTRNYFLLAADYYKANNIASFKRRNDILSTLRSII